MVTLIISGSHKQSEQWAHDAGLKRGEFRIVMRAEHVRGMSGRDARYVLVGTWLESIEYLGRMFEYLDSHEIKRAHDLERAVEEKRDGLRR